MALTIKELTIHMRVDEGEDAPPVQRAAADAGGCEEVDHRQIVDDSVRRVLQALRSLEER